MGLWVWVMVASARSWCAQEVVAHEWGVHVFTADGTPAQGPPIPDVYHRVGPARPVARTPVRTLPADSGERTLPVVHFYGDHEVPLGVSVGFSDGDAAAWFPQVDRLGVHWEAPQLIWDAMTLTMAPRSTPPASSVPWVGALRNLDDAMWVNQDGESERYLFYEAGTAERPAVRIERGDTWGPERPHYIVYNDGEHDILDVLVHTPDGATLVPRIPAGAFAGFLLDADAEPLRGALRERWTTQDTRRVTAAWDEDCVMMRNPADAFSAADGHQMYPAEVAALWSVWEDRFFPEDRSTLVYREAASSLSANMPLALYTDMRHFVTLHRLGIVLVEGVPL